MDKLLTLALLITSLLGLSPGESAAQDPPLKVFILAGQSNMQGHAHVSTLEVMDLDPETAPLLAEIRNEDGSFRVAENVRISSLGSAEEEKTGKLTVGFGASNRGPKIGPELLFGIEMQKQLGEPILIIKTAWGGKSLHTDFRPPSAGPYEFNAAQIEQFEKQGKSLTDMEAERAEATGHYYRLMMDHVQTVLADIKRVYPDYDAEQGYQLAGFVWFQGWNDMVDRGVYPNRDQPAGYQAYSDVLTHFIRDVRSDLSAPKLPFVIGVMGAGGPVAAYAPPQQRYAAVHTNFRNAMAAPAKLPEFQGNVSAVLTENYWDMELAALLIKDAELKKTARQQKDDQSLTGKQEQAILLELRTAAFTPRELDILLKGVSNAEFHYLGSGKIMARIGKGFADAMGKLLDP